MARTVDKLSALRIAKETRPGLYGDGSGLYLRVSDAGAKSWVFRFMLNRRPREMGLGALSAVSLANAREKAADARKLLAEGIDAITARDDVQAQLRLADAHSIT